MTDFEKYVIARWAYSVGSPIISDSEYQILHDSMKALYPTNIYVRQSWSSDPCPTELLIEYGYTDLIKKVVITDKTESIDSLGDILSVQNTYEDMRDTHVGSYKHDGWNVQFSYYKGTLVWAQTRGRASNAKEANCLMDLVPYTIPTDKERVTVVCEATVSDLNFELVKNKYGNTSQRGSVSTLLANPEDSRMLSIHAFDIKGVKVGTNVFRVLESWGFKTPEWCEFDNYQDMLIELKRMSDEASIYRFPTDGWVVRGVHTKAIRIFHWEESIYKSFVALDNPYEEKYGAHRVSIEINIHPIMLSNSTQTQIPVTNLQRVIDNNLCPGYPIAFRLRSSAIAVVDVDSTRVLQKTWQGKEDRYREMIIHNEVIKKGVL